MYLYISIIHRNVESNSVIRNPILAWFYATARLNAFSLRFELKLCLYNFTKLLGCILINQIFYGRMWKLSFTQFVFTLTMVAQYVCAFSDSRLNKMYAKLGKISRNKVL